MPAVRVVLVDDHPVVRNGVKHLLEHCDDIQVVGEAATGQEAISLTQALIPDVLLLDVELPDIKGVEVAERLHQMDSPTRVLILSAHNEPGYIHALFNSGASGYLMKEEAPDMIAEAVRGVAQGEQGWVSRSIAAHMAAWMQGEIHPSARFTRRELDVIRMLVDGKTNQAIAVALGISEKTIEKYLYSIYSKMEVSSRTEAAVYALRENLV